MTAIETPILDQDLDLVEAAKKELPYGTKSYEALMRKHQRLVLRICMKMLNSQEDAEDVCQEVMLKVFHALPKFEGRSSFKTWLSRIATNTCINAYEKAKRSNELKRSMAADPTIPTSSKICSTKRDVDKVMALLDMKDRQLLTLRYVSDLKIDEIAEACGLGLSATKMRLYRAQESLQKLLEHEV